MQETQETQSQSLGQEGPLREGMAIYSSILAQRILWTEEAGGLHSSVQFISVIQACQTLCDYMDFSASGLPVHHQLLEFT